MDTIHALFKTERELEWCLQAFDFAGPSIFLNVSNGGTYKVGDRLEIDIRDRSDYHYIAYLIPLYDHTADQYI